MGLIGVIPSTSDVNATVASGGVGAGAGAGAVVTGNSYREGTRNASEKEQEERAY